MLPLTLMSLTPHLEEGWPGPGFNDSQYLYPTPVPGEGVLFPIFKYTGSNTLGFINLDAEFPSGWPKIWVGQGKAFVTTPYPVGDVDGDGTVETFGIARGYWTLVKLPSGDTVRIKSEWDECFYFCSQAMMLDSDGDGLPEIYWMEAQDATFPIWSEARVYRVKFFSSRNFRVDSVVLHVEHTGHEMAAFSSVRIVGGDFNNDGKMELALLTTRADSDTAHPTWLWILDAQSLRPIKTVKLRGYLYWFPIAADLDGDGLSEFVLQTTSSSSVETTYVVSPWKDSVWALTPAFPRGAFPTIALGDVDGDGLPEIISSQGNNSDKVILAVWDGDGSILHCDTIPSPGNCEGFIVSGDLDGDGIDDILISCSLLWPGLRTLSGFSFRRGLLWQAYVPPDTFFPNLVDIGNNIAHPFLWDVDGDSYPEFPGARLFFNYQTLVGLAFLSLFEIPVQNPHLGWPMLYHDPWNTNNYDFWPPQVEVGESSGKTQGSLTLKPTLKGLLVRSPKPQKLPLKVYDPAGRLLYEAEITLKPGDNLVEIPGKGVRLVMVGKAKVKVVGR